jgi:hypothetical protein
VIVCSTSREELIFVWATLVDRLRISFFLELAKTSPIFNPLYVTRSYIQEYLLFTNRTHVLSSA